MAKEKEITLVNTGVALIIIDRVDVMPGKEITVAESVLERQGTKSLVAQGKLTVKDNSELNDKIIEAFNEKRKPNPTEGKSKAQLEDGGEY
ncbi:hypothetical protein BROOKSBY_9 [Citrobacter phage vB_CfrD_Brooksby]|nr:hypothetical protein FDI94_gp23 [Salmonella phage FSL SP-126]YP_009790282.1 hypothetical protein HOR74_gp83 [Citrobacter phage CF1 DK-2017]ARB06644.1 hypothetical protein GJLI01_19 [Salmonella phage GJL01]EGK3006479.1 hypothetical protein [Salmonella enterica subsp. enterica serovar Kentucky]QMP82739.1 hypothetical protein [Escherichia phage vB_EcoS_011D2]UGO52068.1 hypothetical protein BROOKSBY_9 [Citrobacter phage vB_CfrD_Brooksby]WFS70198.1 hypothetical protein PVA65_000051 [Salmonella 